MSLKKNSLLKGYEKPVLEAKQQFYIYFTIKFLLFLLKKKV